MCLLNGLYCYFTFSKMMINSLNYSSTSGILPLKEKITIIQFVQVQAFVI